MCVIHNAVNHKLRLKENDRSVKGGVLVNDLSASLKKLSHSAFLLLMVFWT